MDLSLNPALATGYKSGAQRARRLTEGWVGDNVFCPHCGNPKVEHLENDKPVADFFCPHCGEQYEVKSKGGSINNRVSDGAYETMIDRITSNSNPNFLFLSYSPSNMCVTDLVVIPKYFFVPSIIEKRPPLAHTAKRAGWVGCNVLLSSIPEQGRVFLIRNGSIIPAKQVVEKLNRTTLLSAGDVQSRGWLFDVLNCVNTIPSDEFTLTDVYKYEELLSKMHPDNRNVQVKIRQQLQLLRDAGYVEFQGRGNYRRLH